VVVGDVTQEDDAPFFFDPTKTSLKSGAVSTTVLAPLTRAKWFLCAQNRAG
jgi:hypothetical protein